MTFMALAGLACAILVSFLDAAVIDHVRNSDSALLRHYSAINDLGKSTFYLLAAAGVVGMTVAVDWSSFEGRRKSMLAFFLGQGLFVFLAVAVSGLLVNLAKLLVGRARPKLFDEFGVLHFNPFTPGYDYASFPSGHATTAGALAMILILWFPRLWLPLAALGLGVGAARVAVNAHYPSDIIAGYTLGALYTLHLARWLAVRGTVFRLEQDRLLPVSRFRRILQWRR